jgi:UDP-N-acetylglucosamine 2-epimerase (non-hydrolysing)
MRVICVAGARPNYMKVKPVMDALEESAAEVVLVHTGQHYDAAMNDVFFTDLGIRPPDHRLHVGSGRHATQTGKVMTAFEPLVEQVRPDVVVVVGDVNSTLGCALVTAKSGALLAHVEAGLRSRDWAMPEEINRVVTDRVSDFLLAPSPDAVSNLRSEGYREDQIHRPGNVDHPRALTPLLAALGELARVCPVVLPAHPRAAARLRGIPSQIRVIPPAGYLDFIALQASARLVLTDSGGVQEETTVLGVPCLTLRENTERPITITEGTNQLVGRDPERIVKTALRVLETPPPPRVPALWDGRAAQRIAAVLLADRGPGACSRPTDLVGNSAPPSCEVTAPTSL